MRAPGDETEVPDSTSLELRSRKILEQIRQVFMNAARKVEVQVSDSRKIFSQEPKDLIRSRSFPGVVKDQCQRIAPDPLTKVVEARGLREVDMTSHGGKR